MLLWNLALADDRFVPNEGAAAVSYDDLVARGVVVGRTGRVLAHGDPAFVADLPGVASVRVLRGHTLAVTPAGDDLALARTLAATPGVRWAHPDLVLALQPASPDDPWLAAEWHLESEADVDIDAQEAWLHATGVGVTIAVLDSGVQSDHPDLSVVNGHDYVDGDDDSNPDADDSSGPHGTGVAGIAAATGDNGYGVAGVAWGADVYGIRVIGGETSLQDIYDAFAEAVDAGAGVVSNSWGYGSGCVEYATYGLIDDMVDYAEETGRGGLGSVVVFAAGNGGCDASGDGLLLQEHVVGVAAIESDDERASYSNYGDTVDIAAPTGLLTTDLTEGGYGSYDGDDGFYDGFSGTSGATPVVSGVVALMLEANPRITAAQVREVLCLTASRNDLDDAGWDEEGWSPYYGCGRVDAGAAVGAVANAEPSAPEPALVAEAVYAWRVALSWEPAEDADGDVWAYEVAWTVDGVDLATLTPERVDGTSLDITAPVAIGDTVEWQVRALDAWGAGPWSEPVSFEVVQAPPLGGGGCGHVGVVGWVAVVVALTLTPARSATRR